MIIDWYQYSQLFSLFTALVCITGLKQFSLAAFIPLLILVNGVEIIAGNFRLFGWSNNYFIYNLYLIFSTPFYLYLYQRMLYLNGNALKIFRIISLLCMLLILLNYFFLQGINIFNSNALVLIMILNIIFSCLALFRLSSHDFHQPNLLKEPYFWINAVNLLFSMVSLVLLGLQPYIRSNNIEIENKSLYYAIMPVANVILYTVYSYAFLLCRIQKTRSF